MMKLHELSPAPGSVKERKRIGRGAASGQGKTAGKGHKGQKRKKRKQRAYRFQKAARCPSEKNTQRGLSTFCERDRNC